MYLSAKSSCQVCVCMCVSMSHSSLPMIIAEVTFWVSDSDRERMWKLLIMCVCVCSVRARFCLFEDTPAATSPTSPHPLISRNTHCYTPRCWSLCVWWEMAIAASSRNANMQMNVTKHELWGHGIAPPLDSIRCVCVTQGMCVLFVRAAFK